MSTNQTVWGVRVYLDTVEVQDTDIGLYTSGTSEFRWIEASMAGTSVAWADGLILNGGISAIKEHADLRSCGGLAQIDPVTVKVANTNKLWVDLEDAGVYLPGQRAEVWELVRATSGGAVTETTKFRGTIEIDDWDKARYQFRIVPSHIHKRRANILTKVNATDHPDATGDFIGRAIPATFGNIHPIVVNSQTVDRYAKMVRTANKEQRWDTANTGINPEPKHVTSFPVKEVGNGDDLHIDIYLCLTYTGSYGIGSPDWVGKYVKIVDGNGAGQYRKIDSVPVTGGNNSYGLWQRLKVSDYFIEEPAGNDACTAEGQSWIEIVDVESDYAFDVWPCAGYVDTSGTDITQGFELCSYDADSTVDASESGDTPVESKRKRFYKLPEYSYVDDGSGDNCTLVVDSKQFSRTPDTINSFVFKAIESPELVNTDTLAEWGYASFVRAQVGLYKNPDIYFAPTMVQNEATLAKITDRDHATYVKFTVTHDTSGTSRFALKCNLPEIDDTLTFNKVYVLVKAHTDVGSVDGGLLEFGVKSRQFLGASTEIKKVTWNSLLGLERGQYVDDAPDFYFTSAPDTNNKSFYFEQDNVLVGNNYYTTGHTLFELTGVTDKEKYDSIYELLITLQCAAFEVEYDLSIYEMAVIFEKRTSIVNDLYVATKGRTYRDTWTNRKASAGMITSLPDIYEHVCRLQNWSEASDTSVDYGIEYSDEALVRIGRYKITYGSLGGGTFSSGDTVTETGAGNWAGIVQYDNGSDIMYISATTGINAPQSSDFFNNGGGVSAEVTGVEFVSGALDHPDIDMIRTWRPAFQLLEYDDGWTDKFKAELCRAMWCVGYVDNDGYECLSWLPQSATTISDSVTLADIVDHIDLGSVIEAGSEDVFVEPKLSFCHNSASNKYDAELEIKNVHRGTWASGYTPGWSDAAGKVVYDWCNSRLWSRYREINAPPNTLSEQRVLCLPQDAKEWVWMWIQWQGHRRISVPVYYAKASTWHVGHHLNLTLPHETAGSAIECVVEGITKDKNQGVCILDLIMLDSTAFSEPMFVQDVMYTADQGAHLDVQDDMDFVADGADKDVHDIM